MFDYREFQRKFIKSPHRAKTDEAAADEAGFSLTEVIIAFAILAMSLIAIHQSFFGSFRAAKRGAAALLANDIAQSVLATASVTRPLPLGRSSGSAATGFVWHLEVQAAGVPVASRSGTPLQIYRAVVKVSSAADLRRAGEISLERLILGPAGKP